MLAAAAFGPVESGALSRVIYPVNERGGLFRAHRRPGSCIDPPNMREPEAIRVIPVCLFACCFNFVFSLRLLDSPFPLGHTAVFLRAPGRPLTDYAETSTYTKPTYGHADVAYVLT